MMIFLLYVIRIYLLYWGGEPGGGEEEGGGGEFGERKFLIFLIFLTHFYWEGVFFLNKKEGFALYVCM